MSSYRNISRNPSAQLYFKRYGVLTPALDLDATKLFIRHDESVGSDEDSLLNTLIASATDWAENYTGAAVISAGRKGFLDSVRPKGTSNVAPYFFESGSDTNRGTQVFTLEGTPISINEVKIRFEDGTSVIIPDTEYDLGEDQEIEFLKSPLSYSNGKKLKERQALVIDYNEGLCEVLAEVPALITQGLLQLVSFWYDNRSQVGNPPEGAEASFAHFKFHDIS